jgi:hypothetical protein
MWLTEIPTSAACSRPSLVSNAKGDKIGRRYRPIPETDSHDAGSRVARETSSSKNAACRSGV